MINQADFSLWLHKDTPIVQFKLGGQKIHCSTWNKYWTKLTCRFDLYIYYTLEYTKGL